MQVNTCISQIRSLVPSCRHRAEVAKVAAESLDLVGIDFRAERKTVDKIIAPRFHP
jgi:hypothetical protein